MDRFNGSYDRITGHKTYIECLGRIRELEKDREFCKHDIDHFLDVSRIAYILSLEDGAGISKDLIYAAGLLHDIGRCEQYLNGVPHEVASAEIASGILKDAGFTDEDIDVIRKAILDHRDTSIEGERSLSGYIYIADKKSRQCFNCTARGRCNWPDEKKNMKIFL